MEPDNQCEKQIKIGFFRNVKTVFPPLRDQFSATSRPECDDKMNCIRLQRRSGLVCRERRMIFPVVGLLNSGTTEGES
jgi:hypothetical protein